MVLEGRSAQPAAFPAPAGGCPRAIRNPGLCRRDLRHRRRLGARRHKAFADYRMGGATLSSTALDCVRRMVDGEEVTQETSGMSKGEWREFVGVIWGKCGKEKGK